ncbi:lipopolysaccharide biosynthesis protein [Acinetobacter soli]|uniref:lipopolysaccharide biosynthesis protein n=1 Tax=Acinetobacter soli TaxID=487316 RepID=UPI00124F9D01|nr:hypothetical protein [Acinetobacter soli]
MIERLLKSTFANSFSLIIRLLEQILLVPIFLTAWSISFYGEWLIITAIPTFLALSDMGFITSGSNELARRASNESDKSVRDYYSHYIVLCTLWCLFFINIILIFIYFAPLVEFFKLTFFSENETKLIFAILCLSALFNQNSLALLAGLRVRGKYHIGLWLRAFFAFLRLSLLGLGLYFFHISPLYAAIIILFCSIACYFIEKIIVKSSGLSSNWSMLFKNGEVKLKEILIGIEYMLLPFSQMIVLQGSIILMGFFFTGREVAIYSTHRTLSRLISSILQMAINPLTAEVGLLQKKHDKKRLKNILLSVSRLTIWISIFFIIILMLSGKLLFLIWTNGKISFYPFVFFALLLMTLFEAVWRTLATVRLGTNHHQPIVRGYFILSLTGTFFAYICAKQLTFQSMVVSYLLIDVFMCIVVAHYTFLFLNINYKIYLSYVIKLPFSEMKYLIRKIYDRREG